MMSTKLSMPLPQPPPPPLLLLLHRPLIPSHHLSLPMMLTGTPFQVVTASRSRNSVKSS